MVRTTSFCPDEDIEKKLVQIQWGKRSQLMNEALRKYLRIPKKDEEEKPQDFHGQSQLSAAPSDRESPSAENLNKPASPSYATENTASKQETS